MYTQPEKQLWATSSQRLSFVQAQLLVCKFQKLGYRCPSPLMRHVTLSKFTP